MRPVKVTVVGTGTSQPVPLDRYISPFNVGIAALMGSGSGQFAVQHTLDDVFATDPANLTWFNHPFMSGTGGTATVDGNYAFPVSAIRLVVTTPFPSGTGTLVVNQAGLGGT